MLFTIFNGPGVSFQLLKWPAVDCDFKVVDKLLFELLDSRQGSQDPTACHAILRIWERNK